MRHIQLFEGYTKLKFEFLRLESVAQAVARQMGVRIDSRLGEGTAGVAYQLRDGRVLKLTGDKTEAIAAQTMIGAELPHIVPFYEAAQVVDTEGNVFYAVIKALVNEISEHPNYRQIESTLFHLNSSRRSGARVDTLFAQFSELAQTTATYKREIFLEMLGIWRDMIEELRSVGCVSYDIYPENCGIYQDRLVFFDIGYVTVPKRSKLNRVITL